MQMYKNVHAGPKIQFGGLKNGLFKSGYQLVSDSLVIKPGKAPKIKVNVTNSIIVKYFIDIDLNNMHQCTILYRNCQF